MIKPQGKRMRVKAKVMKRITGRVSRSVRVDMRASISASVRVRGAESLSQEADEKDR